MLYLDKNFKRIISKQEYVYTNKLWKCYGTVRYDHKLGHVMDVEHTTWADNDFLPEDVYKGTSFQLHVEHFLGEVYTFPNLERVTNEPSI